MATIQPLEDRIRKAHYHLMKHPTWCAFAGLYLMGSWKVVDDPITACVDVRGNRMFGRDYCGKLGDKELKAAIIHETLHFALEHLLTWEKLFKQDPETAGIAADFVVNGRIVDSDTDGREVALLRGPDGKLQWYYDPKYSGWSVKQVYDDIKKNGNPMGGKGGGFDKHIVLEPGDGDGQGQGKPLTPEEKQVLQHAIQTAVRNGAYLAGKGKGNASRALGDMLEPAVDWREVLSEFIMDVCRGDDEASWKRPNRRFVGEDMYLPSMVSESVGELVITADTSGSTHYVFPMFMSEIAHICKMVRPAAVNLIYWDDGVQRVERYLPDEYDDLRHSTKPSGGGGTQIATVADYVYENFRDTAMACINLSDGEIYSSWTGKQGWGIPTLWCLTTRVMSPVGKTIFIDPRDL